MSDSENESLWSKVRIRNLKINIVKYLIDKEIIDNYIFTKTEIKNWFAFKEYDFKYFVSEFFTEESNVFILNSVMRNFLEKVFLSRTIIKDSLCAAEADFIRIYGRYYEDIKRNRYKNFYSEEYRDILKKIECILPLLHWGNMPIFNKYLLFNRRLDPEVDTIKFYDNIDCLNALLTEIKKEGIILSNKSDLSLNREMKFIVYTRRYAHEEIYIIKRTFDGWLINSNGICEKNGTGALFDSFEHDGVFFPEEGVKSALNKLWDDADEGVIDYEVLSIRLQEVADWISSVEKAVGTQPLWVNYY